MTQTYFAIERFVGIWVPQSSKYDSFDDAEQRIPNKMGRDTSSKKRWRIVEVKVTPVMEYVG